MTAARVRAAITKYIREGGDYDAAARILFDHQRSRIPPFAALCRARGVTSVQSWHQVPAVPTLAFKRLDLSDPAADAAEFRTSGTSAGSAGRVRKSLDGMSVMAEAINANARRFLFPDGRSTRIVVMAPSPEVMPHMVMAAGMAQLVDAFGLDGSGFVVGRNGLDMDALRGHLTEERTPLTLIGASFAFVHLLDALLAQGTRYRLAPGSRIMDAGGFKGRSREVEPDQLRALLEDRLGVAPERVVNLLGMTELSSQMYDNVLRDGSAAGRFKAAPPWVRVRVVDPTTLRPVPVGQLGLLRVHDLANLDHPAAIQTDDVGRMLPTGADGCDRFEVFGRAASDGARGCSITLDEMLG